jgi:hypothetical protein
MTTIPEHCDTILAGIFPDRTDRLIKARAELVPEHFHDPNIRGFWVALAGYATANGGAILDSDAVRYLAPDAGTAAYWTELINLLSPGVVPDWMWDHSLEVLVSTGTEYGVGVGEIDSWAPVDPGPYLDGTYVRPVPSIGLERSDGERLLYPGKEHCVIGEMESGKSWFCLAAAAAELAAGNRVLYIHFEESDPSDTFERLQLLGVDPELIRRKAFSFVGPIERTTTGPGLEGLLKPTPSLVILDGVNEAMALFDWDINSPAGAAAYRRLLVKPCTREGSAVLSADHVIKDKESRGRYALGSIHKGNAVTGATFLLEAAEEFGRERRGRSHVYVLKDRPGHLRRSGVSTRVVGRTFMGELVVDATSPARTFLEFYQPAAQDPVPLVGGSEDEQVLRTVEQIIEAGGIASMRVLHGASPLSRHKTEDAVERLLLSGQLMESTGPNRTRFFGLPVQSTTQEVDWDELLD